MDCLLSIIFVVCFPHCSRGYLCVLTRLLLVSFTQTIKDWFTSEIRSEISCTIHQKPSPSTTKLFIHQSFMATRRPRERSGERVCQLACSVLSEDFTLPKILSVEHFVDLRNPLNTFRHGNRDSRPLNCDATDWNRLETLTEKFKNKKNTGNWLNASVSNFRISFITRACIELLHINRTHHENNCWEIMRQLFSISMESFWASTWVAPFHETRTPTAYLDPASSNSFSPWRTADKRRLSPQRELKASHSTCSYSLHASTYQ